MNLAELFGLRPRKGPPAKTRKGKRADMRHAVDGLQCTLGAVLDISRSGMRVWSVREPDAAAGMSIPMVLADGEQRVSVVATVMWVRRNTMGAGWQMGFRFENADELMHSAIENYAKAGYFTTDPSARARLYSGERNFDSPAPGAKAAEQAVVAQVVDLYSMLGLKRGASDEEIKVAYRLLARRLHPDNSGDSSTAEEFGRVSKAFAVLRDPDHRARYDRLLSASREAA